MIYCGEMKFFGMPRTAPALMAFLFAVPWWLFGCGSSSSGGAVAHERAFVSSAGYNGDLGGLAGADAKCNAMAQAANLGGNWVAWLSNSSTDAIDRITGAGPWYLVNRATIVFNNKANLTTAPIVPVDGNENGGPALKFDHYWTGTDVGGKKAASGHNCSNWTSSDAKQTGQRGAVANLSTGSGTTVANVWTFSDDGACNDGGHKLLCLEQ